MSDPVDKSGRARELWTLVLGCAFCALVLLGLVLMWRFNEPQPPGYPWTCKRWIAECALKRPLSECALDARRLGCR